MATTLENLENALAAGWRRNAPALNAAWAHVPIGRPLSSAHSPVSEPT